jgi:hypothetical protein
MKMLIMYLRNTVCKKLQHRFCLSEILMLCVSDKSNKIEINGSLT